MSSIKLSIVNEYRTGLYTISQLAVKYGYSEKSIKNMINPNTPGRVSSTVFASKYLTKDESKKMAQRAAGRKAAQTKRLNKLKKLGLQEVVIVPEVESIDRTAQQIALKEVGIAFDILKDKIMKVAEIILK